MRSARRLTLALGANQLISWATTFYLPAVIAGAAASDLRAAPAAVIGGFSWALLLAGFAAPRIGRRIDRAGGRGVLAAAAATLAAGLVLLACAHGLALWYAAWSVLGIGMALGLYDAAFATAGRLLGADAGPVITGITLFAGFASSVGWPAGAALTGWVGWRGAVLAYAAVQLAVNLPLALLAVPAALPPAAAAPAPVVEARASAGAGAFATLASFFTLRWFITAAIAVYVLPLFRGLGLTPGQAVLAASLIGPGQVAGRALEWLLGGRFDVLARARVGAALFPAAVLLLAAGPGAVPVFALVYGMSNGVLSIHRGTLPLALFGPAGYAARLGRLAVPVLLAQAAAPTLAAPLVHALATPDLMALAGAGAFAAWLMVLVLRPPAPG